MPELILSEKLTDSDDDLREMVVRRVPEDPRHPEGFRYRLAFVPKGHERPAVLYDNHHPKGPHKHVSGVEMRYDFRDIPRLVEDFEGDIGEWKRTRKGLE